MRQSEGWQKVKHGTGVGKGGSDATPLPGQLVHRCGVVCNGVACSSQVATARLQPIVAL
jgi:hypothetical protein